MNLIMREYFVFYASIVLSRCKYMRYDFDFCKLKQQHKLRRIYKDNVYKFVDKYKGHTFSIIDEYGDITHHYHSQILLFILRCNVRSALKDNDILYLESHSNRKYILIPKKIKE